MIQRAERATQKRYWKESWTKTFLALIQRCYFFFDRQIFIRIIYDLCWSFPTIISKEVKHRICSKLMTLLNILLLLVEIVKYLAFEIFDQSKMNVKFIQTLKDHFRAFIRNKSNGGVYVGSWDPYVIFVNQRACYKKPFEDWMRVSGSKLHISAAQLKKNGLRDIPIVP